jgi:hypothetical protein
VCSAQYGGFLFFFFNFSTHSSCIFRVSLLPVFCSVIWCVPESHHIISRVYICYLFQFVIFLSHDICFCNPWFCAAIISLSISPFRSPLDQNVVYSYFWYTGKSLLCFLLFLYKYFANFVLLCWIPLLFVSLFSLDWF